MPDSLYLILAIAGLALLLTLWTYAEWLRWDDQRRLERRVHRNLQRMGGGR